MAYARTQTVAPTQEPLSLAEAKAHLRTTHDEEDVLIGTLITAARLHVEAHTERAFVSRTLELKLDGFPSCIYVPTPPLSSVTSITYVDTAEATQTLATSVYTVDTDSTPGRIYLAKSQSWPSVSSIPHSVTVTYVAGYGAREDVPDNARAAMLLMVGHLYENREAVVVGTIAAALPLTVDALLSPLRVPEFP